MNSRSALLRLINDCKNVRELKQIHIQLVKSLSIIESDCGFLVNRLLFNCALSSSQSLTYAANVFNSIKNPNLSAYNIMIRAFALKHDLNVFITWGICGLCPKGVRCNA
ncbi:hypothetical protein CDL15_Pgr024699 [Punica granatum]|uniref:Pentatricopeptide repeat-containing protein n=1 Tax=Punica granatum TaxID=22663 RepID=A0A218W427_PUNGR|nr:hypothetical protein CDL15_Pgr024699 [Punica granatum]